MYQKPTAPRSIGGVLDDSFQLFKASFSPCLVPSLLISGVVILQVVSQLGSGSTSASGGLGAGPNVAASLMNAVISLVGGLLDVVLYGSIVLIIAGVSRGGEALSFGAAFAASWRRLGAMIGAGFLVGLVTLCGFLLALIPVFMNLSRLHTGATAAQILALLLPQILFSLVLSIPVFYVLSRMMLYTVPLLAESQAPMQSIKTSWHLVGGNWWHTSTVVSVLLLIVYALTIVLITIAGAAAALVVASRGVTGQATSEVALFAGVALALARIFSAPLLAATFVAIYHDLRLRKGGGDLEARLGALPKG